MEYICRKRIPSLAQLQISFGSGDDIIDKLIKFYGFVRRIRKSKDIIFIDLYDGTTTSILICVVSMEFYQGKDFVETKESSLDELGEDTKYFETLDFDMLYLAEHISDGCAVVIDGKLVSSLPGKKQDFELQTHRIRIIGSIDDHTKYPISKSSEKHLTVLRQLPFMRVRAPIMQSIFRITSILELQIHEFMVEHDVVKIDPSIITTSDCEGAGETFKVIPHIFSKDSTGCEIPVGLTVSSQLPLESSICGFSHVYTSQKSFRAEKSDTHKHLAEFLHIEYEGAFMTLKLLLSFTEELVKDVISKTLLRCSKDFDFLESKSAPVDIKSTRELLQELLEKPFIQIKYCDAVDLITRLVADRYLLPDDSGEMKRVKLEKLPIKGEDIGSEHEKLLVKYFGWISCSEEEQKLKLEGKKEFGSFVFLTHWPLRIKSFYMKQCDESDESESFDLLAPRVGELFGCSMREWRYDKLCEEIERRHMDIRPLQWFIDLRKSGSMPHGGWGLGFARLATLITGVPSVRDTVYFPVYYGHCPY